MHKFTIGSIASGMGMHLHGLKQIGGLTRWAIECDSAIADCYAKNHQGKVWVDLVQNVSPQQLEPVDLITITLSCKNASVCKGANRGETIDDIKAAIAAAAIIVALKPRGVIIENVWQYRKFDSFSILQNALQKSGYYSQTYRLNTSDWGIGQSRERLYCVAIKGGAFWGISPPGVKGIGWFESVDDLILDLPRSQLAPWQVAKFPELMAHDRSLVKRVGGGRDSDRVYYHWEPSFTIKALGRSCDNHWHQADVIVDGRVYALVPRALLRLFGDRATADSIWLPEKLPLASEVVGNGASWVIFKSLVQQTNMFDNLNPTRVFSDHLQTVIA